MSKLPPSLAETVAWMVPLIKHLQAMETPLKPFQDRSSYRKFNQRIVMSLTDDKLKASSKVTPLYLRREAQLADALTDALGPEWLVRQVYPQGYSSWRVKQHLIGGIWLDDDVAIVPERTAFAFSRLDGHFVPGGELKNGTTFNVHLQARKFPSESDKVAFLIIE